MVPKIGKRGTSFTDAGNYYLGPKNGKERVEWTHTENLAATDAWEALYEMHGTYQDAEHLKRQERIRQAGENGNGAEAQRRRGPGSECEKPALGISLSWHPDQRPERDHMLWAINDAMTAVGLADHQRLIVAHNDEPQAHVHAINNLVHPETGKVAQLKFSKEKLSRWAEAYEREHGVKIYCQQRIENNARRQQEQAERFNHQKNGQPKKKAEFPRHKDPALDLKAEITKLYYASPTGAEFRAGVEKLDFKLAQGDRILLIDRDGKIYSLSRNIKVPEGEKKRIGKEIKAKLADLELQDVDTVRGQIAAAQKRQQQADKEKKEARAGGEQDGKGSAGSGKKQPAKKRKAGNVVYFDRDRQERQQDKRIIDAAIKAEQEKGEAASKSARAAQLRSRPDDESEEETRLRNTNRLFKIQTANTRAVNRLREKLAAVDAKLETEYGEDERASRGRLEKLEARQRKAGILSRITGAYAKREKQIENERAGLQNIEMRKEEQRGRPAAILEQRQQRAAALNERLKELTAPPRLAKEQSPAPAREVQPAVNEPPPMQAPQPAPPPSPANDFDEAARKYGTTPEYERQRETMTRQQEQQREQSRDRDTGPDRDRG